MTAAEPGSLPPGIVSAVADAFREAHADNVAATHASLDALFTKILEEHEADLAAFAAPLLQRMAEHPDVSQVVKDALQVIIAPQHQTQFFTALFAVHSIIDQFVSAAIAPLVQEVSNRAWPHDPNLPLSPAEAALAVIRGHLSEHDAEVQSEMNGLGADNFRVMVANTGEPPGLAALQEALRRGYIDVERFTQGLLQSRVRNEWLDVMLKLRYSPVSPGEVLAGLVQGHLTLPDAMSRIDQAGINPDNIGWLYETHGRPPGVVELGQLVNRGEMPEDLWEQAVRESDIKNKYIPFLKLLHRRLMPERTVVSAIRQSVLTPAEGVKKLQQLGFDAADSATLASEATAAKKAIQKDLTQAQVVKLYTERLMPKPKAEELITGLGYDASEVAFILALADHDRHMRMQTSAINRVHALYVRYHKTKAETSAALDAIGVDSSGRDDLLSLWSDERDANVQVLTLAQCEGLVRRGIFTPDQFVDRAKALGYTQADGRKLYFLAFTAADQPKDPWK